MNDTTPAADSKDTAGAGKKTAAAPAPSMAAAKQGALLYLGPNRPYDLPLMSRQIIAGTALPAFCREHAAQRGHFAACFVPVEEAGRAMADLKKPGSDIARAAAKVAAETAEQRRKALEGGN